MDDSRKDSSKNVDAALEGLNEANRTRLRRLLLKCSFVTPIVASFGMAALNIDDVAFAANSTAPAPPSDRRAKVDVVKVDTHPAGFGIYRFRYLWSETERASIIEQRERRPDPAGLELKARLSDLRAADDSVIFPWMSCGDLCAAVS